MWLFILLYGISRLQSAITEDALPPNKVAFLRQRLVDQHNLLRSRHKTEPVDMDEKLVKDAESWAISISKADKAEPKKDSPYGQNIWFKKGVRLDSLMTSSDTDPVKTWYDSIAYYTGNYTASNESEYAPFTQIVWKSTKYVGCGFAESTTAIYVVCFYEPKGNVHGDTESDTVRIFSENVLPSSGQLNDNTLSWVFVILIFICVGAVSGWRFYKRGGRRRRSSVRPGGVRRISGAKQVPGVRRISGAKPVPGGRPAAGGKPAVGGRPAAGSKPAAGGKSAAPIKPATPAKPATPVKPAAPAKPAAKL